ncbi:alpha-2-macroglobulin family protein [Mesobacterium pallidum]|uniref:alpha-2-macroglobulin family protein n=1 Tax=Mesobacterium pallidum TaxID=2872037 RepID=UPI001EE34D88|nr:alpha-2-macroglobulin family protein [Mesobacterium pallidum]
MHRFLAAILFALLSATWAGAEPTVPDRRIVVTRDVDFYGGDLQALFDTTFGACQRTCLAEPRCAAFTFNTRSNACFPKTGVTDRQPYEGALSAITVATDPGVLSRSDALRGELFFLSDSDIDRAVEQAEGLGANHPGGQWSVEALLRAVADRRAEGNLPGAIYWQGAAVSQSDASDQWAEFARLMLMVETPNGSQTRTYRQNALSAATNAYLRAGNDAQKVSALVVLAEALEENRRGRDMIPALRLAQDIRPRDDIAAQLDDAIGKYGFRIVEHEVEADSPTPRICAEFNEPLVRAGVDYAPYVRLPDQTLAVEAQGNRLCVAGVTHGSRHAITFRAGLPAASGETLARDVTLTLYVRDRAPSVRFPGRAYVLPRSADAGLPVETVNLASIDLTLARISDRNILRAIQNDYFGRPLDYWQLSQFRNIGEEVWTGSAPVDAPLNRDITTRLPLGEVVAALDPGIYALTARDPDGDEYDDPGATQWFVLSDLGLTTLSGTDGLHVFVRSLASADPQGGVTVELVSRANRVLGTATTDAQGYARFDPGLARGTGGAEPALVTIKTDTDMAFLSLTDPAFDLSDRGVEGREPSPPIDVFLATDRGAYRAGEVIHATVLARDGVAAAIPGLPLTAILHRPDGVEYSRITSTDGTAGGHVFDLPVGSTAPRGTWRLDIHADTEAPALATTALLVEDFLPERIDFDLSLPDGPIRPTDSPPLSIEARYLFGAPAGNLPVEANVLLRPRRTLDAFPGYQFGQYDAELSPRSRYFGENVRTDAQGMAQMAVEFPELEGVDRPLEARIRVTVQEGSGRPVERALTRTLAPGAPMIGIKPLFDGVVGEGTEAAFDLAAISPALERTQMPVKWTLNRVETRYQWYQLYGSWNWEVTTTRSRVTGGEVMLGDAPVEVSGPVDWGRYELIVERVGGDYVASSVEFYAGWYAPADASSTPDTLELSLDKPAYATGETAQLRIVPRYAGKALVTVMSNRLIHMEAIEVVEGENIVPLTVTDDWGAGAYVTAQVIRPMDAPAGLNPARALGLSYAPVDPGAKALRVAFDAPETSDPRGPLTAAVTVDAAEGETAWVTVAAVDLGILNLTGFDSPDPQAHYFGQRRLGMEVRDLYGRLIDGMSGAMGEIRQGGDAESLMRMESPPPTEDLVALFSGPVRVENGRAEVTFDIPGFNGTVRLMAVAWSPTGVGQAEADVLVRDPVVVTASLPRFLAPGDTSRMLLEVTHAQGPTGRMGLDISSTGLDLGARPSGLDLGDKQTARLEIPLAAGAVGDYAIRVALTTPDGKQLVKQLTLGVRAGDPEIATTRRFRLSDGDTFTFDTAVFAGLRPGTGSAMLSAGPLARFDAPGLLSALDRYPYGCTEQVTSQALPMLYFSSVAEALDLGHQGQIDLRIGQAIDRVLSRQAANGAFGLWRADSGDFWLDAYVSDFLSRARAQGHEVPQMAFRNAMDNLRNRVNYAPDFDYGGEDIAYALMVLAREGAAAMGDLRYYADVKGTSFATPLAAAQLGAALAAYGDQTRADAMFTRAAAMIAAENPDGGRAWRADYGTVLRDTAGVLSLAVEAGSNAVNRDLLAASLSTDRPMSTQEQAWSLLAAHAMVADPSMSGMRINGQPIDGPLVRVIEDDVAQPLAITNASGRDTDITLTTFGKPLGTVEKSGYGYAIERAYYTMDGQPVTDPVQTGDRMVVVLTVRPSEAGGARLMVDDPLPAGLEIDNPSLLRSGDVRELAWLSPAEADHAEFRADRFLAAVDWRSADPFRLAYVVRAISPGAFHHPAASVEDMYRPQYRARTASGRLIVE